MILNNLFYITAKVSGDGSDSAKLFLNLNRSSVLGRPSTRHRGAVGHFVPVLAQQPEGHPALSGHHERHGAHRAPALRKSSN